MTDLHFAFFDLAKTIGTLRIQLYILNIYFLKNMTDFGFAFCIYDLELGHFRNLLSTYMCILIANSKILMINMMTIKNEAVLFECQSAQKSNHAH